MVESYTIRLSWPARALWQNSKSTWVKEADAKRAAKKEAWALGLSHKLPKSPDARLEFTFAPPDRRKRDLHNMPATQKATIDGLALAMGVDDKDLKAIWPEEWGAVIKGGAVFVKVIPQTILIEHRGVVG